MVMASAQTGGSMLADVFVVDQYGGYVICYAPGEEPAPVRPGDKLSPNAQLRLTDGATIKLYHEHMGKSQLFTVTDATSTNADGLVEVSDVIQGKGEASDMEGKRTSDDEEAMMKGYIHKYWRKVGQAVAHSEVQSAGVYGWATGGPETEGSPLGPIKGYGKRFSDARAKINQMTLSGELPYGDVCFSWTSSTASTSCLEIADLNGNDVFSATVKGNDMCVDLSRLALDTDKAYTWSVTDCSSGKVISSPVKFKVIDAEAREATLSDIKGYAAMKGYAGIKGYAGSSDAGSYTDLKSMLMEASALADRGLIYDANQRYQEVLKRIEEAKELEYIANALYSDFVKSVQDADAERK